MIEENNMTDQDYQDPARFWKALSPTDPKYVKPADRPGLPKGLFSSIDPMWRMMRLTEYFGPIGQGWGFRERIENRLVIDAGEMTLIYVTLECWYVDPETKEKYFLDGFGGDSITKKKVGSPPSGDDEALKKCVTDALMNAFMRLGLSADVWLGKHKDSKYVATIREHFENQRAMQHQLEEDLPKLTQS